MIFLLGLIIGISAVVLTVKDLRKHALTPYMGITYGGVIAIAFELLTYGLGFSIEGVFWLSLAVVASLAIVVSSAATLFTTKGEKGRQIVLETGLVIIILVALALLVYVDLFALAIIS